MERAGPCIGRLTAAALALALTCGYARAETTARDVIAGFRTRDPSTQIFVEGLLQGLTTANAKLGANALYCLPHDPAPRPRDLIDIMERYLDRLSPTSNGVPGDVLVAAVQEVYACAP